MNALDCIKTRRSIRQFTGEKVPHTALEEIVETARFAPSWKNTQTPRYLVVESPELLAAIREQGLMGHAGNTAILSGCSALVVETFVEKRCGYERDGSFSTSKGDRWQMFDAGLAAEAFCLAAHDKGVGSVIMGIFDEKAIASLLPIPEGQQIAALIAIGYPVDPDVPAPKRKEVAELLSFC